MAQEVKKENKRNWHGRAVDVQEHCVGLSWWMERSDIPPSGSKHNAQGDSFSLFFPLTYIFFLGLFDLHTSSKSLHKLQATHHLAIQLPTHLKVLQPTTNPSEDSSKLPCCNSTNS